ncbi:MAG: type II toxin-antitoxin system HicB family antitoxin [Rickettsiales bacterium]|jgi:predicted RNase H-like HicB family nuclease|nr:type II toxin-antitoxin system HicB family antitoxin [Rickettsiales bacterium]
MVKKYIAVFIQHKGKFNVLFPDFDGLVSQGDTYDDALRMAHEALSVHVEGMREDGLDIPNPSSLAEVRKNWWGWDDIGDAAWTTTLISELPSLKAKRYTLTMNPELMARIDSVSSNRSAFLSSAAEYILMGNQKPSFRMSGAK